MGVIVRPSDDLKRRTLGHKLRELRDLATALRRRTGEAPQHRLVTEGLLKTTEHEIRVAERTLRRLHGELF